MQNLNNRLAGYIDKVRRLQADNSRLGGELRRREEQQAGEVHTVQQVHQHHSIDSEKYKMSRYAGGRLPACRRPWRRSPRSTTS